MPAVRIKDHWREQRLFDQRAVICSATMAVATFGLIVRLFVLQVARHEYYADLSQGNRVRNEPIPAARGLILDRHGEVIAGNQPGYQLELVPETAPASCAQLSSVRRTRRRSSAPSPRAAGSTACRSACACRTRTSRVSPCGASSFRAWISRHARPAGTRTPSWRCTRSATWAPSASRI